MRDGFKIFDSDTHLSPHAETLEPYFDAAMRKRLPEWESCKVPFRVGWAGEMLCCDDDATRIFLLGCYLGTVDIVGLGRPMCLEPALPHRLLSVWL